MTTHLFWQHLQCNDGALCQNVLCFTQWLVIALCLEVKGIFGNPHSWIYSKIHGCLRIYLVLYVLYVNRKYIYLHFNPRQGQVYWKERRLEIKEIAFLILALEIISWTRGNLLIRLGFNIFIKINCLTSWIFSFLCLHCAPDDLIQSMWL